jgi:hypothetical protein
MLAPPRPPAHDEIELLIREARARQRRRRLAAVVVIALLAGAALGLDSMLAGGGLGAKAGGGPRAVASLPRCRSGQLRVAWQPAGVAAGTVYERFSFTNASASACVLSGWPTFRLVLRDGSIVRQKAHDLIATAYSTNHPPPVPRIALRPGSGTFVNVFEADGAARNGICPTTRTVLVTPPGARSALRVPATIFDCRWIWVLPIGRKI